MLKLKNIFPINYLILFFIIINPAGLYSSPTLSFSLALDDFQNLFHSQDGISSTEGIFTASVAGGTAAFIYKYDNKFLKSSIQPHSNKYKSPFLHSLSSSAYWYGKNKTNLFLTWGGITGSLLSASYITQDSRHLKNAVILAESTFFSSLIVISSKIMLGRERPSYNFEGNFRWMELDSKKWSMPSGHTTLIFTFASVLAHSYDNLFMKIPAYTFAVCSGLERIEHKKHWPSDVIVGAVLGYYIGSKTYQLNQNRGSTPLNFSLSISPYSYGLNLSLALP